MIFFFFWGTAGHSQALFTEAVEQTEIPLVTTAVVDSLASFSLISSFTQLLPVIVIPSLDYDDEYDEPERDLMLFPIVSMVLLLVVIITGLYLSHRWGVDEDPNDEHTRGITDEIDRETPAVA
jgi:hypothetical protein